MRRIGASTAALATIAAAALALTCLEGGGGRPQGSLCADDRDCGALVCVYGRCRAECTLDRDCTPEVCRPDPDDPTRRACVPVCDESATDPDCPRGDLCVDGICIPEGWAAADADADTDTDAPDGGPEDAEQVDAEDPDAPDSDPEPDADDSGVVVSASEELTTTLGVDGEPSSPSIAWNADGAEIGLAWVEDLSRIRLARLSPSGALVGGPFTVDAARPVVGRVEVVWTGTAYAVAWSAGESSTTSIRRALVSPSGELTLPDHAITFDQPARAPRLALGTGGLALTTTRASASGADIYYCVLDPATLVVTRGPYPIGHSDRSDSELAPPVLWSGSDLVVAWVEVMPRLGNTLFVGRVSASSSVDVWQVATGVQGAPALAANPGEGRIAIAWSDSMSSYWTTLDATGEGWLAGDPVRFDTAVTVRASGGPPGGYGAIANVGFVEARFWFLEAEPHDGATVTTGGPRSGHYGLAWTNGAWAAAWVERTDAHDTRLPYRLFFGTVRPL